LKVDQSADLNIRFAASPKSIFEEGGQPVLMQLLNGISVDVSLNVWRKLSDLLMRIVGNVEVDASLLPILGVLGPLFLLRVNGKLDLTIDDYMKNKIQENPLVEPVLLDAATLISSTSGQTFENDEELFKHIQENVPAPFGDVAALLSKHLGDTVEVEFIDKYVGVKGRITGEGLNLIL